eukprot:gene10223-11910_t
MKYQGRLSDRLGIEQFADLTKNAPVTATTVDWRTKGAVTQVAAQLIMHHQPLVCKYNSANSVALSYTNVTSGSESALAFAIAETSVSVYIDASQISFQLYSSGVYYDGQFSSTVLDLCLLLVRYGTQTSESYWIVRNDWGTDRGLQGYILKSKDRSNNCGIASQASFPILA